MVEVYASAPVAQQSYATFWRRFAAFLIDNTLIHLLLLPFLFLYFKEKGLWDLLTTAINMRKSGFQFDTDSMGLTILFGSLFKAVFVLVFARAVFDMLYHGIWEATKLQATPGKLAVNIKVVDAHGNRLSLIHSLTRNFLKILSNITFLIGYILALVTEKHQALHDKIANCYIINITHETPHLAGVEYAGFLRRALAFVLDFFLISLLLSPLKFFMEAGSQSVWDIAMHNLQFPNDPQIPPINEIMRESWLGIVSSFLFFFYYASFESSRFQATPGKIAIGIRVTDTSGQRISFWRAAGRYIAKYVSNVTLLIGYIMAAATPKKQALHDELADTLVIKSQVPK